MIFKIKILKTILQDSNRRMEPEQNNVYRENIMFKNAKKCKKNADSEKNRLSLNVIIPITVTINKTNYIDF